MNKFKEIYNQAQSKITNEDQVKHLSEMLRIRFLHEIETISTHRNISRKELASMIGVSASYITQLYRGSAKLNFETLGKFENSLNIRFQVKALHSIAIEEGAISAILSGPIPDFKEYNSSIKWLVTSTRRNKTNQYREMRRNKPPKIKGYPFTQSNFPITA